MSDSATHSNSRHKKHSPDEITSQFDRMVERVRNTSPNSIYVPLAELASRDEYLVGLASQSRPGQIGPRLLFSAVHYLILRDAKHPLASSYQLARTGTLDTSAHNLLKQFRDFCVENEEQILPIITTRAVQLNEVRRCGYLIVVLLWLDKYFTLNDFDFIDVGASAGLNTLWPSYRYLFSNDVSVGAEGSPLVIKTDVTGLSRDILLGDFPKQTSCIGIDRNPVDLSNTSDRLWLKAQIPPDDITRSQLLNVAIEFALKHPPEILSGDAQEILTDLLVSRQQDMGRNTVLFLSHSVNQIFASGRDGLWSLLANLPISFPVFTVVSSFFGNPDPGLYIGVSRADHRTEYYFGECDIYGRWLRVTADPFATAQDRNQP